MSVAGSLSTGTPRSRDRVHGARRLTVVLALLLIVVSVVSLSSGATGTRDINNINTQIPFDYLGIVG